MENKIIVEKGTFEYNDKEYSSYFIAGKIKGKDVKVALMPPDKGGWAVLDILFSDTNQGELVVKPYELKDEKTGKVTATGNTYAVRTVDENGEILDGDFIMTICAMDMRSRGTLAKETMVGTVMANMGVNRFCADNNIGFVATSVGDRYVLEEMLAKGYNFGGEQSGHVIFLDYGTTGDGQLTAAQLLSIVSRRNAKLSNVRHVMKKYPQVLINIKVSPEGRAKFATDSDIAEKIDSVKNILGKSGRILVRVSGTEPLVRVMLEGESEKQIQKLAQETADLIKERLS